jgi:hypothetical protein
MKITDKQRLDFLAKKKAAFFRVRGKEGFQVRWKGRVYETIWFGVSYRDAIDQAIQDEPRSRATKKGGTK